MVAGRGAWGGRLGLVGLGVVIGVVVAVVVVMWPRRTLVQREDQPATVRYADGAGHHVGLFRERTLFSESYHLVISGDPGLSYGHRVDIGAGGSLRVRAAEWTDAGVRVRFVSGHELFVPAALFIGGR
ncbi:hypothetical protein [Actinocorallia longicatena]|uniref:Uncharacterized protein n=1 Tax=Actinocorallia longicatena TaxID=111803 RepID=A0ABP6QC13_9ACTN